MSVTEVKLRRYDNGGRELYKCNAGKREVVLQEKNLFVVSTDSVDAEAAYNPHFSTIVDPYPTTENMVSDLVSSIVLCVGYVGYLF